jgi:hypothetical protein
MSGTIVSPNPRILKTTQPLSVFVIVLSRCDIYQITAHDAGVRIRIGEQNISALVRHSWKSWSDLSLYMNTTQAGIYK